MKKITFYYLCLFLISINFTSRAQSFVPLPVNPAVYNYDVIANGSGSAYSTTTIAYDDPASRGVYYSMSWRTAHSKYCGGIPNDGIINRGSGYPYYQLVNVDNSGNNCLYLNYDGANGTFELTNPGYFKEISICASAAGVGPSVNADLQTTLHFTTGPDVTSYVFSVPDWYNQSASNYCINALGRVHRETVGDWDADQIDGCGSMSLNPRMFDCRITLTAADRTRKLEWIQCTKTSGGTNVRIGVFAVCGVIGAVPEAVIADPATNKTINSFQANWHPSPSGPSPTSYRLDVSTSPTFGTFVTGYNDLDVGNVTNYTVYGLPTGGGPFYYRLRGVNADGVGPGSNVITVNLDVPMPVIADPATHKTINSFYANWHPAPGDPHPPTSYRLDVSTSPTFGTFVTGYNDLNVGNLTTYPVTGLPTGGGPFYYRLRGVNADGAGASSNVIEVNLDVPMPVIADPATNKTNTSFQANWHPAPSDPYPPTSYRLDVSTSPTFGTFVTGYNDLNVGNVTTYPVTSLTPGAGPFYYRLRGVNADGTGENSNVITVTLNLPLAVIADPATLAHKTINFHANWHPDPTDPYPPTSYRLDVSTSPTFASFLEGYNNLDVGAVTTYPVVGVAPGVTYYYRVRGVNADGTSPDSNIITTLTIPTLSEWGLIIMSLLLVLTGTIAIIKGWGTSA